MQLTFKAIITFLLDELIYNSFIQLLASIEATNMEKQCYCAQNLNEGLVHNLNQGLGLKPHTVVELPSSFINGPTTVMPSATFIFLVF